MTNNLFKQYLEGRLEHTCKNLKIIQTENTGQKINDTIKPETLNQQFLRKVVKDEDTFSVIKGKIR